jgi:nucleotide-binding universal stress UspA family protein
MSSGFRIVVGVDGSEGGRRALRWAVREAEARGGTVQAVGAWRWDVDEGPRYGTKRLAAADELAERAIRREVASVGDRAAVPIGTETVEGRAADVLTSAASDANLLVLGSHGHSRVWHTVLGSVSEECIRKATCPVVVVPARDRDEVVPAVPAPSA